MRESGGLDISGILLVDKPPGMTSHDVVAGVRKLIRPVRVGHTGTLDPLATGLLILCIGKATRIADLLQSEHKVYRASVLLGVRTETQDIEGAVLEQRPAGQIPIERIEEAARFFTGSIAQKPPQFSAVKIGGIRAYRLARRHEKVSLEPRRIEIRRFQIEEVRLPSIEFVVECSKGTYVRTLCSDFGDRLGAGGCMQSLRRLSIGRFSVADAVPFAQLAEAGDVVKNVLPLPQALAHLPNVVCTDEQSERILHGMRIPAGGRFEAHEGWVSASAPDGRVLAVGKLTREGEEIFFQPRKVLSS
ncbi:MAG: tRNA pseudouridine(55) synthase TruB [Candidatus Abyssobacteria bacterium SURF_5]|uniref:tRNA pseudouridine synthase B n=1 Tax=Abyssobacteria bacterium (strain SURF_5) TaxID=2093360 RepID=A0A3A4P0B7_ABYX5|nr:MAG: tRNA pseudouridine(55) synthase TruB [Candidatus Abyssubacteria bacterium SURF_5]